MQVIVLNINVMYEEVQRHGGNKDRKDRKIWRITINSIYAN